MNIYRVYGKLEYCRYCDCSYCDGHEDATSVDRIIHADNPRDAIEKLLSIPGVIPWDAEIEITDAVEQLTVVEAKPEFAMRALGMPTLFDLEPAP